MQIYCLTQIQQQISVWMQSNCLRLRDDLCTSSRRQYDRVRL